MRYMFTRQPDEGCHEVESGIYGRPVQTCDQGKLKKAGWSFTIDAQRGNTDVRQGEEERQEEGQEVSGKDNMSYDDFLRLEYERVFGKRPHHKLKAETIAERIKEAESDG